MKALCKMGIVLVMVIANNEVLSWFCLLILACFFLARLAKEKVDDD